MTHYVVADLSGQQYGSIFSSDREAIRVTVIAAVNDWLDEILCVPREQLRGHPGEELKVRILT